MNNPYPRMNSPRLSTQRRRALLIAVIFSAAWQVDCSHWWPVLVVVTGPHQRQPSAQQPRHRRSVVPVCCRRRRMVTTKAIYPLPPGMASWSPRRRQSQRPRLPRVSQRPPRPRRRHQRPLRRPSQVVRQASWALWLAAIIRRSLKCWKRRRSRLSVR